MMWQNREEQSRAGQSRAEHEQRRAEQRKTRSNTGKIPSSAFNLRGVPCFSRKNTKQHWKIPSSAFNLRGVPCFSRKNTKQHWENTLFSIQPKGGTLFLGEKHEATLKTELSVHSVERTSDRMQLYQMMTGLLQTPVAGSCQLSQSRQIVTKCHIRQSYGTIMIRQP